MAFHSFGQLWAAAMEAKAVRATVRMRRFMGFPRGCR
jgi:hypothetical protein